MTIEQRVAKLERPPPKTITEKRATIIRRSDLKSFLVYVLLVALLMLFVVWAAAEGVAGATRGRQLAFAVAVSSLAVALLLGLPASSRSSRRDVVSLRLRSCYEQSSARTATLNTIPRSCTRRLSRRPRSVVEIPRTKIFGADGWCNAGAVDSGRVSETTRNESKVAWSLSRAHRWIRQSWIRQIRRRPNAALGIRRPSTNKEPRL